MFGDLTVTIAMVLTWITLSKRYLLLPKFLCDSNFHSQFSTHYSHKLNVCSVLGTIPGSRDAAVHRIDIISGCLLINQ